jgi:hypothetical protein
LKPNIRGIQKTNILIQGYQKIVKESKKILMQKMIKNLLKKKYGRIKAQMKMKVLKINKKTLMMPMMKKKRVRPIKIIKLNIKNERKKILIFYNQLLL